MTPSKDTLAAIKMLIDSKYTGQSAESIAAFMNVMQSQTPAVYQIVYLTKAEFMLMMTPAILAAGANPTLQSKWSPVVTLLLSAPDDSKVNTGDQIFQGIFQAMVADGLISSEQVNAITAAGRVEVLKPEAALFGYASLSIDDITATLSS